MIKLQQFRTNDLILDTGKQIEFGKAWVEDYFEIPKKVTTITLHVCFKALSQTHEALDNYSIELTLSPLTSRNDRKAYVNGESDMSQLKDFFINKLHLTKESNLQDYFCMYKIDEVNYDLFYIPKLLEENFIKLFQNNDIDTSIERNYEKDNTDDNSVSLQIIYYGAPGTGKSHIINEITTGEDVIRTTFHPDTDYSTFVGAYKPTTIEETVMTVIGKQAEPVKNPDGKDRKETKIVYEFVEQAFLQAYIGAWKKYAETQNESPKKQYLVIEEINRGNCAQIFGDLFQLLDRNGSGFSDYPIKADSDMKKYLAKAFCGLDITVKDDINAMYKGRDVVSEVLKGEILLLPSNLFIWATMNTSDQSLFPIDSAFKRRWDWHYMPICKGEMDWKICTSNSKYDWWSFLEKINKLIGTTTNSEDKKLGFFFCKAKDDCISAETFVAKVIFYLWNDVFKDYGFDGPIFKDTDGTELSFHKFYETDTKGNALVREDKVELFLKNLELSPIEQNSSENTDGENIANN